MRPYLVLCAVVLIAVAAFGQQRPVPRVYGACLYGCGPYVPLITTPMISLETVSPNPVGASNATTGLVAGATNGTLSQIAGATSSTYTAAVWYQGGAPLITPEVNLWPQPLGHERHAMREGPEAPEHGAREETRKEWVYFTGSEHTTDLAGVAKGSVKRSYSNEDVTRQNEKNGNVHYDGKTEKIQ